MKLHPRLQPYIKITKLIELPGNPEIDTDLPMCPLCQQVMERLENALPEDPTFYCETYHWSTPLSYVEDYHILRLSGNPINTIGYKIMISNRLAVNVSMLYNPDCTRITSYEGAGIDIYVPHTDFPLFDTAAMRAKIKGYLPFL